MARKSKFGRSITARAAQPPQALVSQATEARPPRRWFFWLVTAIFLLVGAATSYYLIEVVFWPRIPAELVGIWQVRGGPQDGVVLEFRPNGAFQARVAVGAEGAIVNARAEVQGKQIHIASVNPTTGKDMVNTHIIHRLTATELRLEDPTGLQSTLVRLE